MHWLTSMRWAPESPEASSSHTLTIVCSAPRILWHAMLCLQTLWTTALRATGSRALVVALVMLKSCLRAQLLAVAIDLHPVPRVKSHAVARWMSKRPGKLRGRQGACRKLSRSWATCSNCPEVRR